MIMVFKRECLHLWKFCNVLKGSHIVAVVKIKQFKVDFVLTLDIQF